MVCGPSLDVMKSALVSKPEECFDYTSRAGPWFTVFADGEMPPRIAKEGFAGPQTPAMTVPAMLKIAAGKKGQHDALLTERPVPPLKDGKAPPALPREQWTKWTFQQYLDHVRAAAEGLIALGCRPFDSVNIWSTIVMKAIMGTLTSC